MKAHGILAATALFGLGACGPRDGKDPNKVQVETPEGGHISLTAEQMAEVRGMKPVRDPANDEAYEVRLKVRKAYNERQFDELERIAADVRANRRTISTGGWAIVQYYGAFSPRDNEPESLWKLHDKIHKEWIAAKPDSIAARVAHADFLSDYGWHARGGGYANTVSEEGWKLFKDRIDAAREVLEKARNMKEKDPYWWWVMLSIARSQGWNRAPYDALVAEAHAFEPKFWGYDTERAFSLLPRWYGKPGEWETFAEQTAARPEGLGAELYARIVMNLSGYYNNVFKETKASWPKTREGLEKMQSSWPDSLGNLHNAALLASQAGDQAFARAMFDKIDNRYLASAWDSPEQFVRTRDWAKIGKW